MEKDILIEKELTVEERLKMPFPSKDIQWRIGSKNKNGTKATVLAYVDARAIQERLDEVFDNWSVSYTPVDLGSITVESRGNQVDKHIKGFLCTITGYKDGKEYVRQDGGDCTDFEPFKGGLSSALKRAAAAFGIGRYLYDLGDTWVDLKDYGKFDTPTLPDWALPEAERKGSKATTTTNSNKDKMVDMSGHKCVGCGVDVTENVAKFSNSKFNKVLCFNCQRKENV